MTTDIKTLKELVKMAKQLKADYCDIERDDEDYKRFVFVWNVKK